MNSNIRTFPPHKSPVLAILTFHVVLLCSLPIMTGAIGKGDRQLYMILMGILVALSITFTVLLYYRTYYRLNFESQSLEVYCIFRVKNLPFESIRKIEKSNPPLSGFRYSLGVGAGLNIYESRYDAFFISPAQPEQFIAALKSAIPKLISEAALDSD